MKTLTNIALVIFLTSCGGSPICADRSQNHDFDKWEEKGKTNLSGQSWLVRTCKKCGWKQESPSEIK